MKSLRYMIVLRTLPLVFLYQTTVIFDTIHRQLRDLQMSMPKRTPIPAAARTAGIG